MKLPKYVAKALIDSAKHHEIAMEKQRIFEDWLEENYGEEALNDDSIRDTLIDLIEQTNSPDRAIKLLEADIATYDKIK